MTDPVDEAEVDAVALEGWVLVPVEPTEAMLEASWATCIGRTRAEYMATALASPKDAHLYKARIRYRAMIDAHRAKAGGGNG